MINALLASLTTFIVWLVTTVTTGVSLPFFQLVMLFGITFLFYGFMEDRRNGK